MAEYISFQPSDFFNTVLWTGTGASQAITGVGFQPDFVWGKKRSGAYFHGLFDSARGATKYIQSDATAAEVTNAESLKTFDVDGFTAGTIGVLNEVAATYVGWNWKAGTTTGLTGGTITPSAYSINTTSGFSAIAYTGNAISGATVPHGLGVAPKMIIVKALDVGENWRVYHTGVDTSPQDKYMILDTTAAVADATWVWNDTAPTSTLFSLGTGGSVNASGDDFIAYCFADVKGYSKFSSYTGNGNADGPFIYTGFRPSFVMVKKTAGESWAIIDDKRLGYNVANYQLFANATSIDTTETRADIVSNGFKVRTTNSEYNTVTGTYIYAAFAEFPIVSSNDVPVVAR